MISIRTVEISCACLPSFASFAAIALVAETSPNCTTRRSRWRPARRPGGQRLLDELLLVAAAQVEAHEDRAAVLGGERTLDRRDAVDPLEPAHDLAGGGGRGGIAGALALNEHLLARALGEAGGLDDHVAALGLAAPGGRVVEVVLADAAADDHGEDDEQDPAEDGRPAVLGAPSTDARCKVARLHFRSPP